MRKKKRIHENAPFSYQARREDNPEYERAGLNGMYICPYDRCWTRKKYIQFATKQELIRHLYDPKYTFAGHKPSLLAKIIADNIDLDRHHLNSAMIREEKDDPTWLYINARQLLGRHPEILQYLEKFEKELLATKQNQ